MRSRTTRAAWMLAGVAAVVAIAPACSSDDEEGTDSGSGSSSDASGEVIVSGSSTVEPISTRVAELLEETNPDVVVTVDGPGTGDGFELFCNGETDISDASRPIAEDEIAACEENGVEFIELKIAFDGITVMTNPANDAIECMSFADLYALIGPESEGFDTWAAGQELATELGSTTTFPDAPLDLVGPGTESGTYDSFIEIALEGISEERAEAGDITEDQVGTIRNDYSSQADDNAIITQIEGSDTSLGWVGFAFAEEAGDGVKELEVSEEPGGECVAPSAETIADGTYPISRSLYIYVSKTAAEENPAVKAYVDFYLADGIAAVEEVGYVALPDDQLSTTRETWESMTTGSAEASGGSEEETTTTTAG